MNPGTVNIARSTPQLYRDCMRLINHIAGNSAKGRNIKRVITSEFRKHSNVTDSKVVESLKSNAIRGLSNYLMLESLGKDDRFKNRAIEYAKSEADDLNSMKKQ